MKEIKDKELKNIQSLAKNANKKMTDYKYLSKKLEIYNNYNNLTKETMSKFLANKNISTLTLFNDYTKKIKQDYDKNKKEYENVFSKFNSLLNECRSDITMGKPVLAQKESEEFIFGYLKEKKTDIINLLKKYIKISKDYHLFREPKRDNLIDIKRGNKIIEKITNELQSNVLYEFKKCNKFSNKIKKYESKKVGILKNIGLLNNYIESNKNTIEPEIDFNKEKIRKEDIIKTERDKNIDYKKCYYTERNININFNNDEDDDEKESNTKRKDKNKIILEFMKVEDLFDISSEEGENEKIINEELHSDDDEGLYEEKIKIKKQLSTFYLEQIKNTIPHFNFNQIHFNKTKVNDENDIYSLQRRRYKSKNIDNKIKEMNKKIKKINVKIDLLKQKESIMKEFIKKLQEKYEDLKPMIYQTSVYNIISNDFIVNSLNYGFKKNDNEKVDKDNNDTVEEKDEEPIKDISIDEIFGEEVEEEKIISGNKNESERSKNSDNIKIEAKKESQEITEYKNFDEEEKVEKGINKTFWNKNKSAKKIINLKPKNKKTNLPKSILVYNIKKNINSKSKRGKSK